MFKTKNCFYLRISKRHALKLNLLIPHDLLEWYTDRTHQELLACLNSLLNAKVSSEALGEGSDDPCTLFRTLSHRQTLPTLHKSETIWFLYSFGSVDEPLQYLMSDSCEAFTVYARTLTVVVEKASTAKLSESIKRPLFLGLDYANS